MSKSKIIIGSLLFIIIYTFILNRVITGVKQFIEAPSVDTTITISNGKADTVIVKKF